MLGPMHVRELNTRLSPHGLTALGSFAPQPEDPLPPGTRALVLIGPDGGAMWPVFTASDEYYDGAPEPLNRWRPTGRASP